MNESLARSLSNPKEEKAQLTSIDKLPPLLLLSFVYYLDWKEEICLDVGLAILACQPELVPYNEPAAFQSASEV